MHGNQDQKTNWTAELATFVAVLGFAWYSWVGVQSPLKAPSKAVLVSASRSPASVSVAVSAKEKPEHSTQVVEIGCLGEKPQIELDTQASLLRVKASACRRHVLPAGRNVTTGEGLLIFAEEGGFTTHYFPLKIGKNLIVLQDARKKFASVTLAVNRSERELK